LAIEFEVDRQVFDHQGTHFSFSKEVNVSVKGLRSETKRGIAAISTPPLEPDRGGNTDITGARYRHD
jgi:hypothetical protein